METDSIKLLVREYIEKVINTGNTDNIEEYISKDYAEVFNSINYPLGIKGAKEHIAGVHKTYSDLNLRVDMQVAEGEWVATSYTMKGRLTGSWMGIKPNGKEIVVTGVNTDRVVKGRIVEHGGAANLFNSLLDIGVIKVAD